VGFYEPSPGNNWQYQSMSQRPEYRAKRVYFALSLRVAKHRSIPCLFMVQCNAGVTRKGICGKIRSALSRPFLLRVATF